MYEIDMYHSVLMLYILFDGAHVIGVAIFAARMIWESGHHNMC